MFITLIQRRCLVFTLVLACSQGVQQKLGKDAPSSPNVNLKAIVWTRKDHFWRSVESGGNSRCQNCRVFLWFGRATQRLEARLQLAFTLRRILLVGAAEDGRATCLDYRRLARAATIFGRSIFLNLTLRFLFGNRHFQRSRQTKIAQLDLTGVIHENVAWFYVAMHNTKRMKEIDAAKQVVHNMLDVLFGQMLWLD